MAYTLIAATLGLLAVATMQGQAVSPQAKEEQCRVEVQERALKSLENGVPPLRVDREYQALMLRCLGVDDTAFASYAGAMRVEFARLANLFLNNQLSMEEYVRLVQDRRAKLRRAQHDAAWTKAYQASGDKDGDFVPDSLDKCANSPADKATNTDGCLAPPRKQSWASRVQKPTDRDIDAVKKSLGFMATRACEPARRPESPEPIHQGYKRSPAPVYSLTVTRVRNQPAGCPVFYQVEILFRQPSRAGAPDLFVQTTFRDDENRDTGPTSGHRRVFQAFEMASGSHKELFETKGRYGFAEWRVRAINGMGMTSGWSPYKKEKFDGTYGPLQ